MAGSIFLWAGIILLLYVFRFPVLGPGVGFFYVQHSGCVAKIKEDKSSYNNYRYTYEDPIQACNSIIDWWSKGIQYISFINRAKRVSDEREQYLDDWKYAFQQLETQVKQFLGSGHTPRV
jgi:hypothetical protein